ncbi:ABC transporter substrate-binding protein [Streptococcus pneumoniae]|uniref:ABC transporter substrate-binding protein n=1 Tax=Streptococcus pneumoniae TaxID=1313 RepID=UPI0002733123|nr:ABC transporter substrate-binding protein [Streptococcus pneumoniae]EJG73351.1 bacterial extracellular solute-binding protein, family 3 [Streptococcus pneumoniae 2082239]CVY52599.1 ABC transporter substrate-binding lipoprotein [Streptococcus pneumoniae]CWF65147.1 ABC transporter substrate-binding lipoprotein [Streptococcus pneumoniae]
MKSKKWIFVLCNFLASFFLVACQSGSNGSQSAVDAIKQKGKLVVATSPDYAPFEFQSLVDGKNQVVGADIDMAQAIADELGVKLEISSMSFDNVLTSLQTGKADLAVAGISATDERKEVFDFSIPYYENKISFLVRKADVEKYKDLTSLESANIAAHMGEAVNELQVGKVDAVHMDEPVALSYAAKNAGLAVATVSLKMKDGDANAVALRKNSDDLKEVVDKVIQKLKDEGTYQSYLEKAASLTEVEE